MNLEAMRAVLDRIRQYDRLILFRHLRPDGDCVGASKGLKRILELSYPDKRVILPGGDCPDDLRFLGEDDPEPSEAEYADALGIVVDTGSADRISNPNWARCRELVKIDHHPDRDPYAATSWVEEERSSACEMIAALPDRLFGGAEARPAGGDLRVPGHGDRLGPLPLCRRERRDDAPGRRDAGRGRGYRAAVRPAVPARVQVPTGSSPTPTSK